MELIQFDTSILKEKKELQLTVEAKKSRLEEAIAEYQALKLKGITSRKLLEEITEIYNNALAAAKAEVDKLRKQDKELDAQLQETVKKSEEESQSQEVLEKNVEAGKTAIEKFGIVLAPKKQVKQPKVDLNKNRTLHIVTIINQLTKYLEGEGVAPIDGEFLYTVEEVDKVADLIMGDYESGVEITKEHVLARFSLIDCEVNRRALERLQSQESNIKTVDAEVVTDNNSNSTIEDSKKPEVVEPFNKEELQSKKDTTTTVDASEVVEPSNKEESKEESTTPKIRLNAAKECVKYVAVFSKEDKVTPAYFLNKDTEEKVFGFDNPEFYNELLKDLLEKSYEMPDSITKASKKFYDSRPPEKQQQQQKEIHVIKEKEKEEEATEEQIKKFQLMSTEEIELELIKGDLPKSKKYKSNNTYRSSAFKRIKSSLNNYARNLQIVIVSRLKNLFDDYQKENLDPYLYSICFEEDD